MMHPSFTSRTKPLESKLEITKVTPWLIEAPLSYLDTADDVMFDHPLDIRGDKIYLSDRPALGIEMDKDYMRAHVIEGYGG
jgi:L-alanine-DL-glutamate epimerase-like enolase superfamily enzyme